MNATDHLSKYGVTPTLKTDGKIGLQGVGSLAEPLKSEIIAWAKNHRTKILKELSTDVKNVFTEKDPPWTTEEWEDFRTIVELLEERPQLWSVLRGYAKKSLHPVLFSALVDERYGEKPGKPVADPPRAGRIKCRECERADSCPVPERQKRQGLETLHRCEGYHERRD